jgi:hypothetical protein
MNLISSQIEYDWLTGQMVLTSDRMQERHWADATIELPFTSRESLAIAAVLKRPWFQRLWIWQEIWLANSKAVLVCGRQSVLWSTFPTLYLLHNVEMPSLEHT